MATAERGYRTDPWQNSDNAGARGGTDATDGESVDRVLAVYGPTNTEKIERHVKPLADVVETTLVCTSKNPDVTTVRQLSPPSTGIRIVDLLFMALLTAVESVRGEYDAVVSISLVPHGCLGLMAARWMGVPAHLGIIGYDIDVHARSWYAPPIRALIRQFDAVTVPGPTHRRRLHESVGLPPRKTAILANPIDVDQLPASRRESSARYDLLWVGRFTEEKRPLLFVDVIAELAEREPSVRAVMLGDGPQFPAAKRRIQERNLEDTLHTPGWIDDPIPWYSDAKLFALTSKRDALPLTLIEAMASETVPVAPPVGNVSDLLVDDWNGVLVDPATVDGFATAFEALLNAPERRRRLGRNARGVRDRFSYRGAAEDWRYVTGLLALAASDR